MHHFLVSRNTPTFPENIILAQKVKKCSICPGRDSCTPPHFRGVSSSSHTHRCAHPRVCVCVCVYFAISMTLLVTVTIWRNQRSEIIESISLLCCSFSSFELLFLTPCDPTGRRSSSELLLFKPEINSTENKEIHLWGFFLFPRLRNLTSSRKKWAGVKQSAAGGLSRDAPLLVWRNFKWATATADEPPALKWVSAGVTWLCGAAWAPSSAPGWNRTSDFRTLDPIREPELLKGCLCFHDTNWGWGGDAWWMKPNGDVLDERFKTCLQGGDWRKGFRRHSCM